MKSRGLWLTLLLGISLVLGCHPQSAPNASTDTKGAAQLKPDAVSGLHDAMARDLASARRPHRLEPRRRRRPRRGGRPPRGRRVRDGGASRSTSRATATRAPRRWSRQSPGQGSPASSARSGRSPRSKARKRAPREIAAVRRRSASAHATKSAARPDALRGTTDVASDSTRSEEVTPRPRASARRSSAGPSGSAKEQSSSPGSFEDQ